MDTGESTVAGAGDAAAPLPPFHRRVLDTFFSPGRLGEALAQRPVWGLALAVGALLVVLQTALIPAEIYETAFREAVAQRGQELPENFSMGTFMRLSGVIGGLIFWFVYAFLIAGVTTLIFAFFLGDEGSYKQYLAVLSHALLIPALVGLALLPLRIAQQDPQLTLNLSSFFFFLDDGYPLKVLRMLDLSQLWASLVVAQGAHAIDSRRSFASAAAILVALNVVIAMIFAIWVPAT